MKKNLKLAAISLALVMASSLASATENIAIVNGDYLFQNHPQRGVVAEKLLNEFKSAQAEVDALDKKIQEKLVAANKKIDAKKAAYEKEKSKLRPADAQKREAEIQKLINDESAEINKLSGDLDAKLKKYRAEYAKRDSEEVAKLVENINEAVRAVAKEKKYTAVFNQGVAAFIADDSKNITEDVLKALSSKKQAK